MPSASAIGLISRSFVVMMTAPCGQNRRNMRRQIAGIDGCPLVSSGAFPADAETAFDERFLDVHRQTQEPSALSRCHLRAQPTAP